MNDNATVQLVRYWTIKQKDDSSNNIPVKLESTCETISEIMLTEEQCKLFQSCTYNPKTGKLDNPDVKIYYYEKESDDELPKTCIVLYSQGNFVKQIGSFENQTYIGDIPEFEEPSVVTVSEKEYRSLNFLNDLSAGYRNVMTTQISQVKQVKERPWGMLFKFRLGNNAEFTHTLEQRFSLELYEKLEHQYKLNLLNENLKSNPPMYYYENGCYSDCNYILVHSKNRFVIAIYLDELYGLGSWIQRRNWFYVPRLPGEFERNPETRTMLVPRELLEAARKAPEEKLIFPQEQAQDHRNKGRGMARRPFGPYRR